MNWTAIIDLTTNWLSFCRFSIRFRVVLDIDQLLRFYWWLLQLNVHKYRFMVIKHTHPKNENVVSNNTGAWTTTWMTCPTRCEIVALIIVNSVEKADRAQLDELDALVCNMQIQKRMDTDFFCVSLEQPLRYYDEGECECNDGRERKDLVQYKLWFICDRIETIISVCDRSFWFGWGESRFCHVYTDFSLSVSDLYQLK